MSSSRRLGTTSNLREFLGKWGKERQNLLTGKQMMGKRKDLLLKAKALESGDTEALHKFYVVAATDPDSLAFLFTHATALGKEAELIALLWSYKTNSIILHASLCSIKRWVVHLHYARVVMYSGDFAPNPFPVDILQNIASYLPHSSVTSFKQVSRTHYIASAKELLLSLVNQVSPKPEVLGMPSTDFMCRQLQWALTNYEAEAMDCISSAPLVAFISNICELIEGAFPNDPGVVRRHVKALAVKFERSLRAKRRMHVLGAFLDALEAENSSPAVNLFVASILDTPPVHHLLSLYPTFDIEVDEGIEDICVRSAQRLLETGFIEVLGSLLRNATYQTIVLRKWCDVEAWFPSGFADEEVHWKLLCAAAYGGVDEVVSFARRSVQQAVSNYPLIGYWARGILNDKGQVNPSVILDVLDLVDSASFHHPDFGPPLTTLLETVAGNFKAPWVDLLAAITEKKRITHPTMLHWCLVTAHSIPRGKVPALLKLFKLFLESGCQPTEVVSAPPHEAPLSFASMVSICSEEGCFMYPPETVIADVRCGCLAAVTELRGELTKYLDKSVADSWEDLDDE